MVLDNKTGHDMTNLRATNDAPGLVNGPSSSNIDSSPSPNTAAHDMPNGAGVLMTQAPRTDDPNVTGHLGWANSRSSSNKLVHRQLGGLQLFVCRIP